MSYKFFIAPNDMQFKVPADASVDDFNNTWNEIFGDLQLYRHKYCDVKDGDTVLDLGANIGLFTLKCLLDHSNISVISVEAELRNAFCLAENISKYSQDDSNSGFVLNYAIYSHCNGVKLNVDKNRLGSHYVSDIHPRLTKQECQVDVKSVTIDKIVKDLELEKVDFMKFDIEGSEVEALIGAEQTIKKFKPKMIIATYHVSGHKEQIEYLVSRYRSDYTFEFVNKGRYDQVLVCW